MAAKGHDKFYEIFVDSLKAVQKTDEPSEFDGYEDYMTAGTNQIKIVIYCSGVSPRNDQYVFAMKAQNQEEALDLGLNGVEFRTFTKSDLTQLRNNRDKKAIETQEIQALRKEIAELNNELEEKEAYIEQLEKGIETAKANGNKIGGMHIGEIVSVALEGIVRRNTHLIAQVPALNGLAGIIDKDTEKAGELAEPTETEASFKKKEQGSGATQLTEQEKEFLRLFKEIQKHFTEEEMQQVIDILEALSKDKEQIQIILDLLQEEE
jgi:hypothetical protein